MALSQRAHELSKPDPAFLLWDILQDMWHPDSNPAGYVSLGLAENSLLHEKLAEHIHRNLALPTEDFTYGDGKKRLRNTLARFLNKHLRPLSPFEPAHITVTNGCSSAIEHVSWAFGNTGDVFLLGRPYYGTFVPDLTVRMGTELAPVSFGEMDPLGAESVQCYEDKILEMQASGKRVAGLILAHPHNPLGRCYPREVLVGLMKLCERYKVHLVSDEIYALSTFSNTVDTDIRIATFESVSSIDTTNLIDPALVHVIWGISKDFGANGLRLGAIISQNNPRLHAALTPVQIYSSSSSLADHAAANFLDDDEWADAYIEENQRLLAENYVHVTSWAKNHNIQYKPGVNAAFFLWVNLGKAYTDLHPGVSGDLDKLVMDLLLKEKVFLASGVQFGSEVPGWFRIVFSQKKDYLDLGLDRILKALNQ